MSNLRRMLSRAMRTSPWGDGKKDRQWSMTKRRQRRAEERETRQLADEDDLDYEEMREGIPPP